LHVSTSLTDGRIQHDRETYPEMLRKPKARVTIVVMSGTHDAVLSRERERA
jgi:hypothetical protein